MNRIKKAWRILTGYKETLSEMSRRHETELAELQGRCPHKNVRILDVWSAPQYMCWDCTEIVGTPSLQELEKLRKAEECRLYEEAEKIERTRELTKEVL